MDFFVNLTLPQKLLCIFVIVLLLFLFFASSKKNKNSIKLTNKQQANMAEKYNEIIEQYNELIGIIKSVISQIENDEIVINSEDDFVFIKKKLDDFHNYDVRINSLIDEMPKMIEKNKKQGFQTAFKDSKVYIQEIKNIIIEINTIVLDEHNEQNNSFNNDTERSY